MKEKTGQKNPPEKGGRKERIEELKKELEELRIFQTEDSAKVLEIARELLDLGERPLDLSRCCLKGTKISLGDLRGANLSCTDCEGVILKNANLRGAVILRANFRGADLSGSNLAWAHLFGTDLREANMEGTILDGAFLNEADLRGAKSLTAEQLLRAYTLFKTKLDPGLLEKIKKQKPVLLKDPNFRDDLPYISKPSESKWRKDGLPQRKRLHICP